MAEYIQVWILTLSISICLGTLYSQNDKSLESDLSIPMMPILKEIFHFSAIAPTNSNYFYCFYQIKKPATTKTSK